MRSYSFFLLFVCHTLIGYKCTQFEKQFRYIFLMLGSGQKKGKHYRQRSRHTNAKQKQFFISQYYHLSEPTVKGTEKQLLKKKSKEKNENIDKFLLYSKKRKTKENVTKEQKEQIEIKNKKNNNINNNNPIQKQTNIENALVMQNTKKKNKARKKDTIKNDWREIINTSFSKKDKTEHTNYVSSNVHKYNYDKGDEEAYDVDEEEEEIDVDVEMDEAEINEKEKEKSKNQKEDDEQHQEEEEEEEEDEEEEEEEEEDVIIDEAYIEKLNEECSEKMNSVFEFIKKESYRFNLNNVSSIIFENEKVKINERIYIIKHICHIKKKENLFTLTPYDPYFVNFIYQHLIKQYKEIQFYIKERSVFAVIPPISQSLKEEMKIKIKNKIDESKISLRNVRSKILKKLEAIKNKIGKDIYFKQKNFIQSIHDQTKKKIEKIIDDLK